MQESNCYQMGEMVEHVGLVVAIPIQTATTDRVLTSRHHCQHHSDMKTSNRKSMPGYQPPPSTSKSPHSRIMQTTDM